MVSSMLSRWAGPAPAWVAAFIVCVAADALLGRWVLFPIFVVGFYGGMLIMASLIYPLLERWRLWLRPRGVRAWFLVEVGLWVGIAGGLVLSAPRWLGWLAAPAGIGCPLTYPLHRCQRLGPWDDGLVPTTPRWRDVPVRCGG